VKLWATSDLHVGYEENRSAVERLTAAPEDWLIIAGDTGESLAHLELVLKTLTPRFAQIVWTPGNHDLWTPRSWPSEKRGEAHYQRLVRLCQRYGALTPEDPYAVWPGDGPRTVIVPTFLLYDYSFRPDDVPAGDAVAWAAATGVRCADEELLAPDPYPSRTAWCHARVALTEQRLAAIPSDAQIVLVNHFPLRRDHAVLPRIPRFSIWCGTRATEDWHLRYRLRTVVYGHLHLRSSRELGDVKFEEVSLGYPKQWRVERGLAAYLRAIL
jgi:3',5'-cyclic AMP phosphodiesterase CpdA